MFDAPLIAGLSYREDVISEVEEEALVENLDSDGPVAVPLPRLARQPQDDELRLALRFRRRQLCAGRTHSRLARPSPRKGCGIRRVSDPEISSTSCSPATIPARASAGTATGTCSRKSSASRSRTSADAALPPPQAGRLRSCQPRGCAALRLPARRRGTVGLGAPASRRATGCASRSPSGHCPIKAARIAAARHSGTRSRGNGCARMRWVPCLALLVAACSKGPEADLQYIKQARSVAAEWALVNELAVQGKADARLRVEHAPMAARRGADLADLADRAGLAIRR